MTNTKLIRESVAKTGIRRIDIDPARSQSPTFGGLSFGSVGQYEKLRGTAYGELDPSDPRNAVITDIELAPVNANGLVEYSMDIFILKPINLSSGNHRMLFDFNNRGQMRVCKLNDAPSTNDPTTAKDAGTGFDEDDIQFVQRDIPEVAPDQKTPEFGNRAGKLDAGRPAAHDNEGQKFLPLLRVERQFGALEGQK